MISKVYVVQSGPLYNWIIYGVFSSREKAEQCLAEHDDDEVDVEEYDMDSQGAQCVDPATVKSNGGSKKENL